MPRVFSPAIKVYRKHNEPQNHLPQSDPSFSFRRTTTSLFSSHGKRIAEGANYNSKPLRAPSTVHDGGSPLPWTRDCTSCAAGKGHLTAGLSRAAHVGRNEVQGCWGCRLRLSSSAGARPPWQPQLLLTREARPKLAAALGLRARRYGSPGPGPRVSISQHKICAVGKVDMVFRYQPITWTSGTWYYLSSPLSLLASYHLLIKILTDHWIFFGSHYFYKASFYPFFPCLLNFSMLYRI